MNNDGAVVLNRPGQCHRHTRTVSEYGKRQLGDTITVTNENSKIALFYWHD